MKPDKTNRRRRIFATSMPENVAAVGFASANAHSLDKDNNARIYAYYTLATIAESCSYTFQKEFSADSRFRAVLIKTLKDQNRYLKSLAAQILAVLGKGALPDLLPLLKDEDKDVRIAAAQTLGSMVWRENATKDALVPLAKLLRDRSREVRETAISEINRGLHPSSGDPISSYKPKPPE